MSLHNLRHTKKNILITINKASAQCISLRMQKSNPDWNRKDSLTSTGEEHLATAAEMGTIFLWTYLNRTGGVVLRNSNKMDCAICINSVVLAHSDNRGHFHSL